MTRTVEITKEDFNKFIYFALSKFRHDSLHIQGTSSKSDYIGGFIDRWINRISEELIFNKLLLSNKNFSAGIDYYLYDNRSEKNAPDILGLETQDNDILPFAKFNNSAWFQEENMPWIEIKTFRANQKLLSVRDSQMKDEHYYVITELHTNPDYLSNIFSTELFDEKYMRSMEMRNDYIENDINDLVEQVKVLTENTGAIGTVKLLGIFKGEDLKKYCNLLGQGESIKYISSINKVNRVPSSNNVHRRINLDNNGLLCLDDILNIKIENSRNVFLKKINKGSLYIEVINECKINGILLITGIYKISFSEFKRSSSWTEFIAHKNTFDIHDDRTEELLKQFDEIIQEHTQRK